MKTFTRDSLQRLFDGQGRQNSGGSTESSVGFSYWKLDENGRLYTEYDVYSQKGISALGAGSQEGGGILGPLLTSLNSENMPPAAGYLHWTGSAWEWSTPSGGGGGGTEFDEAAMWQALASSNSNQINASHLTNALSGYATQSWISSNYLSKDGGSMNVTTLVTNLNANYLQGRALTSGNNVRGRIPFVYDGGGMEIGNYIDFHKSDGDSDYITRIAVNNNATGNFLTMPSNSGTIALTSDISNSLTGIFSALSSSSSTKLSITVGDTTRTLTTLYASSSDQLTTARSLWGQSFNGSSNITGSLTSVHDITMDGWLRMDNDKGIQMKDKDGNLLSQLILNSGNAFAIGYGSRTSGYITRLYGGILEFYSNNSMTASTNTDGLWTFTKGIYLQGGTRTSASDYSCLRIGDGMIVWDSTNNALKVIKADGSNANYYITGSLTSVHDITMDGWLRMDNDKGIQMKDKDGNLLSQLILNSENAFAIGYGSRTSGYITRLYGGILEFYSNNVMTASTNTDGLWTFTKGIYLQGGTRTSASDYSCIRIGDGMIVWDSTNNALKVIKADGSNANFYATGGVSALGAGNGQIETLQVGTLELTSAAKISANSSNEITLTSTGLKLSDNTSKQLLAVDSTGALTIGSSTQGGNLYIYYNGRRYQLNISQAISNGILS